MDYGVAKSLVGQVHELVVAVRTIGQELGELNKNIVELNGKIESVQEEIKWMK